MEKRANFRTRALCARLRTYCTFYYVAFFVCGLYLQLFEKRRV